MDKKIGLLIAFILLLLIASAVCSCTTTRYIPVTTTKVDTIYKARQDSIINKVVTHYRDSVAIHDSVVVRTDGKDTWHWRDRVIYKSDSLTFYKSKCDSLLKSKVDTIVKPYKVCETKTVNKLNGWQKFVITLGYILMICVIGVIVYYVLKLMKKFGVIHI